MNFQGLRSFAWPIVLISAALSGATFWISYLLIYVPSTLNNLGWFIAHSQEITWTEYGCFITLATFLAYRFAKNYRTDKRKFATVLLILLFVFSAAMFPSSSIGLKQADAFTIPSISNNNQLATTAYNFLKPFSYFIGWTSISGTTEYFALDTNGTCVFGYCGATNPNFVVPGNNASQVIQIVWNQKGSVFVFAGNYTIGNLALNLQSNLYVQGMPGTLFFLGAGQARHMIGEAFGPASNVTFNGIDFNGNKLRQTDNPTRASGELFATALSANNRIQILNSVCDFAREGTCMDLAGTNIVVSGDSFLNNGETGATFASDALHFGTSKYVRLFGNLFQNSTDTGLAMDGVSFVSVTANNFVDSSGQLTSISNGSQSVSISGNTYNQSMYTGNFITAGLFGFSKAGENISISGNSFNNFQTLTTSNVYGISVTQCKGVDITSNTMTFRMNNVNDFAVNLNSDNLTTVTSDIFQFVSGATSPSGILLVNDNNFSITLNDFSGGRQDIQFATTTSNNGLILGNNLMGTNLANPIQTTQAPTNVIAYGNQGYNFGTGSRAVAAIVNSTDTPFTYTNTNLFPVNAIIQSGTVTALVCNGITYTTNLGIPCYLSPGKTEVFTWTGSSPFPTVEAQPV